MRNWFLNKIWGNGQVPPSLGLYIRRCWVWAALFSAALLLVSVIVAFFHNPVAALVLLLMSLAMLLPVSFLLSILPIFVVLLPEFRTPANYLLFIALWLLFIAAAYKRADLMARIAGYCVWLTLISLSLDILIKSRFWRFLINVT
jgi:hypothetical protein